MPHEILQYRLRHMSEMRRSSSKSIELEWEQLVGQKKFEQGGRSILDRIFGCNLLAQPLFLKQALSAMCEISDG